MARFNQVRFVLLAAALGAAAWAGYRAQARRAAVLGRIAALDGRLAARNRQRAQAARQLVSRLRQLVHKNRNQARDIAVLQQARQIQAVTQALADTLRQLRRGQAGTSSPAPAWLPGALTRYQGLLAQFVPFPPAQGRPATSTLPDSVPQPLLSEPPSEPPPPARALSDWFGEVDLPAQPAPAARATLTRLETRVRQVEAAALEAQARKVGSPCICFDKNGILALAESQTVAPGAEYRARLLMSPAATGLKLLFSADGRPVPLDPRTNHGQVRFRVPATRPGQPDTVRAQWLGRVQWNSNGNDTTVQVVVPYFIVKHPTP